MHLMEPKLVTVKLSPSVPPDLASMQNSLSDEYQDHGSRSCSRSNGADPENNPMSISNLLNPPVDVVIMDSQTDDSDSDDVDPDGSLHIKEECNEVRDITAVQYIEHAAYSPVEPKKLSMKAQAKPRDFRPAYEIEQGHFLWFFKIDKGLDWNSIYDAFKVTFPQSHRDKPGLQCKFYRVLSEYGMPNQRELARLPTEQLRSQYGFQSNRRERYSWSFKHGSGLARK